MTRWRIEISMVLMLVACGDGNPWGVVDPTFASAPFEISPERQTDTGALRTARSYGVQLTSLTITYDAMTAERVSEVVDLSFDPANPPPGYSLCHNGHCHADSGALVDYADIERELSGVDAEAPPAFILPITRAVDVLTESGVMSDLPCQGCDLTEPGVLTSVRVNASALSFEAIVTDESVQGRLSPSGVLITATVPIALVLASPTHVFFDNQHKLGARIDATATLPQTLFDDVDWSALVTPDATQADLGDNTQLAEALTLRLDEDTTLTTVIDRFEP